MLLEKPRSIVIACDVYRNTGHKYDNRLRKLENIIRSTDDIEGVGGYQISSALPEKYTLSRIVKIVKNNTGKRVIYDQGGFGLSNPKDAEDKATDLKESGVDAVIIFPISGPAVAEEWIKALINKELGVIVRGHQSYPKYDMVNEGYVGSHSWRNLYEDAIKLGVRDLQFPANQIEDLKSFRENLRALSLEEDPSFDADKDVIFYPTGIGDQGGRLEDISAFGQKAHPIVGRLITSPPDRHIRNAALRFIQELERGYKKAL